MLLKHVYLKFFLFLAWTLFRIFNEFVTILLLFYIFWFFGQEACGILVSWPGIKPTSCALEGEVLTTRPTGKSQTIRTLKPANLLSRKDLIWQAWDCSPYKVLLARWAFGWHLRTWILRGCLAIPQTAKNGSLSLNCLCKQCVLGWTPLSFWYSGIWGSARQNGPLWPALGKPWCWVSCDDLPL